VLLFIANTINIGADLGAMGEAVGLLIGGPHLIYVIFFGVFCAVLQIVMQYTQYVSILKWLTVALFAYFGRGLQRQQPFPSTWTVIIVPASPTRL
jgi:hypothetical protein